MIYHDIYILVKSDSRTIEQSPHPRHREGLLSSGLILRTLSETTSTSLCQPIQTSSMLDSGDYVLNEGICRERAT